MNDRIISPLIKGIQRRERDSIKENQRCRQYTFGTVKNQGHVFLTIGHLFAIQRKQGH